MSYRFDVNWWHNPAPDGSAAPIVTVTASGVHDVGRLLNALAHGNCEQAHLAHQIARKLRYSRKKGRPGLATLRYLEKHGGPVLGKPRDLTL